MSLRSRCCEWEEEKTEPAAAAHLEIISAGSHSTHDTRSNTARRETQTTVVRLRVGTVHVVMCVCVLCCPEPSEDPLSIGR